MSRTYDRDTKHYDFAVLTHLVETGEATFYEGPGIFVIKTEDGTVAVRPNQVIFTATPAPFTIVEPVAEVQAPASTAWAESLAEEYLTALHGPAENRDGEFDDQARAIVNKLVHEDEDREYANTLRDAICEAERGIRPATGTSWVSASEQDEILGYFGI